MIEYVSTGWLFATATGGAEFFTDLTIQIPRRDITAVTAPTAFSLGVTNNNSGSIAAAIREYGQFADRDA